MKIKSFLSFICVAVMLYSCSDITTETTKQTQTKTETNTHYQLIAVKKEGLPQTVKLPAQLAAYEEASIVPKVNGYVKSVLVDIGSHVTKGQLLMTIEAPELAQQVLQAKENYAHSLSNFSINKDNYTRLVVASKTAGAISPMELASAKAKMESDSILGNSVKASWQMQQTMMNYLRVTAPFTGVITERNTHPGALVSAAGKDGQPMLEIKQIDKLRLQIDVPESVASALQENDEVSFYLSAFPGKKMTAKLSRKSDNVNIQYRSERIELDVPNPKGELSPGMYADVVLQSKGNPDAVVVPKSAVVTTTERKYVLAVRDGNVVKVDVATGNEKDLNVEVVGELSSNDQVISNANEGIEEGKFVK